MKVECTVGVELETIIDTTREAFKKLLPKEWKVVSDGSLPGAGWEAVSDIMSEDIATSGLVSKTIDHIIANGGRYVDAEYKTPPQRIEELPAFQSIRYWCEQVKLAKDQKYKSYVMTQLKELRNSIKDQWKEASALKKQLEERKQLKRGDRQPSCGFHVHVSVKGEHPLPVRTKQIASIIYSFYYNRFIENILTEARQNGGNASNWATVIEYEDSHQISNIRGNKYEAVNVCSNHGTIEYRQGSVNQYTTPEKWISLLCDITRGAHQIHKMYPDIKTVGEVKALLPFKLKSFRLKTWGWSKTEEDDYKPETYSLESKIPQKILDAAKKAAEEEKARKEAAKQAKIAAERAAREAELAENPPAVYASVTEESSEIMRRLNIIRSRGLCTR